MGASKKVCASMRHMKYLMTGYRTLEDGTMVDMCVKVEAHTRTSAVTKAASQAAEAMGVEFITILIDVGEMTVCFWNSEGKLAELREGVEALDT